jgi:uncharacterized protein
MLPLDLVRLSREGALRIQGEIRPEDPLWEGTEIRLKEPLRVDLKANEAQSGEIVVRGKISGTLAQECRRCLEPVDVPLEEEVTFVFAPPDLLAGVEDGEMRVLPAEDQAVDLAEPIREELMLAAPAFVVCKPDCKGLCPHCGTDLNESTCECAVSEPDPRWDALRALKKE